MSQPLDLVAAEGGCYRIRHALGSGGSSTVYQGSDGSRDVAIKVLHDSFAQDAEMRAVLAAEAALLGELDHPALPRLVATGLSDARPWFAMERCPGTDLQSLVEVAGPLDLEVVGWAALQICDALDYLHRRNLSHGDLKPANVVVGDRVAVVDLGACHIPTAHQATIYGSPHFLAPERIRGEMSTAASDVYALGALLYFALVGAPVFEGNSLIEVCDKHLHETPTLREAGLPRCVEEIVLACLAKRPEHRPNLRTIRKVFTKVLASTMTEAA